MPFPLLRPPAVSSTNGIPREWLTCIIRRTFGLVLLFSLVGTAAAQPAQVPASPAAPAPVELPAPATADAEQPAPEQSVLEPSDAGEPSPEQPSTEQPTQDPAVPEPAGSEESVAGGAVEESVVESRLETAPLSAFDARDRDEIWVISSRHAGSRHHPLHALQFRRQIEGDVWQTESADRFLNDPSGTDRIRNTVIFVHGNRTPEQKAVRRGLQTYDQTFKEASNAPSSRFVIWLWPADQIPGQIRDVRTKAYRADEHAFHLARLIGALPADEFVSVIGYSFGGRLSVDAMHLLGGGSLCGSQLGATNVRPNSINLTLVVPAIRNDCFVSTRRAALHKVNHLFVMYNTRDQYLKLYKFLRLDNFTPALGFTGICGLPAGHYHGDRIDQYNASSQVGPDHDYLGYIADERVERGVQQNLFHGQVNSR
ncbi:MAG: hypothetical protein R3C05_06915 [Pirellulaceae bacterium]